MKKFTKALVAITFSLALIVPVVANTNAQDVKKEKTETVKKECKEAKKCCTATAEKKCCDKKKECTKTKK